MTIILFPELQRRLVDQDQLSNDATELTESARKPCGRCTYSQSGVKWLFRYAYLL